MDAAVAKPAPPLLRALAGRSFVHPLFDYLLIGGGASLVVMAIIFATGRLSFGRLVVAGIAIPLQSSVILACNSAHFAASSVRLYTKPGSFESLPFVTMAFPLLALLLLLLAVAEAGPLAAAFQALYLTWSPYHYGAQAYGLSVMYAYRSGCALETRDKRWLRGVALLPFAMMFFGAQGFGLSWLVPAWGSAESVAALRAGSLELLRALMWAGPPALYLALWWRRERPLPLISLLTLTSNAVWFGLMEYRDAFVWATVFHGLQYLAIAMIFHVKDQSALPGNRHGGLFHALRFYALCLALGYGLFFCLPQAFLLAGFGMVESMLMVVAAINLHHFLVDAYIWRLGRSDGNREIVERGALVAAPARA